MQQSTRRTVFRLAGMLAHSRLLASGANRAGPREVELPLHKVPAGL